MPNRKLGSIVEYFPLDHGNSCGYCRHEDTSFSNGMWAHRLTVQDYQDLIDRGWRRSGKYIYKPVMDRTCCPQYPIKCVVNDFKLSRSHKKVIKQFNRYINADAGQHSVPSECEGVGQVSDVPAEHMVGPDCTTALANIDTSHLAGSPDEVVPGEVASGEVVPGEVASGEVASGEVASGEVALSEEAPGSNVNSPCSSNSPASATGSATSLAEKPGVSEGTNASDKMKATPKPGLGADPNRPVCQKAKERRKERWRQKNADMNEPQAKTSKPNDAAKSLEQLLGEISSESKHKFEVRLVRSSPRSVEFEDSFQESYAVYKKYQVGIHGDPPDKPTQRQYTNFLVESPLQPEDGLLHGYGSFHQQYVIDGRIVAVGVFDILPMCVSSVYLYYDPDYAFLSIGTYSALCELAFTRRLLALQPVLKYYCMGFYIHSCPKMKYKGQYVPSFILCPETYNWVPIETCRPRLDEKKYSRLDHSARADVDVDVDVDKVLVLWEHQALPFQFYSVVNPDADDAEEVAKYALLVGSACAQRMLLVRS